MAEQLPLKQLVAGSNPAGVTESKFFCELLSAQPASSQMFKEIVHRLGIRSADTSFERKVVPGLESFLNQNYRAIRAMRSLAQIWDGQFDLDPEQIEELKAFVKEESNGNLDHQRGLLCEIWDDGEEFQHHGAYFGNELKDGVAAIKGFRFVFALDGRFFECVGLDDGKSRAYFDSMSEKEKYQFVKRFAYKNAAEMDIPPWDIDWALDFKSPPVGFCAFISDEEGKFKIEKVVAKRAFKFL